MVSPVYKWSAEGGSFSGTTTALAEGAGGAVGDIIYAMVGSGAGVSITAPAGWTGIFTGTDMSGGSLPLTAGLYWIRRGASAPSFAFTIVGGAGWLIAAIAFSGAYSPGDPIGRFASYAPGTAGTTVPIPSISPFNTKSTVVVFAFGWGTNGAAAMTVDNSFTIRDPDINLPLAMAHRVVGAGVFNTGITTFTEPGGSSSETRGGYIVEIMPSPSVTQTGASVVASAATVSSVGRITRLANSVITAATTISPVGRITRLASAAISSASNVSASGTVISAAIAGAATIAETSAVSATGSLILTTRTIIEAQSQSYKALVLSDNPISYWTLDGRFDSARFGDGQYEPQWQNRINLIEPDPTQEDAALYLAGSLDISNYPAAPIVPGTTEEPWVETMSPIPDPWSAEELQGFIDVSYRPTGTDSWSFEIWFTNDDLAGEYPHELLSFGGSVIVAIDSATQLSVNLDSTGAITAAIPNLGTSVHHLVVTYDNDLLIRAAYLDGISVLSGVVTANTLGGAGYGINIGWGHRGKLAHVAMYRYVLTPERILAHARTPVMGTAEVIRERLGISSINGVLTIVAKGTRYVSASAAIISAETITANGTRIQPINTAVIAATATITAKGSRIFAAQSSINASATMGASGSFLRAGASVIAVGSTAAGSASVYVLGSVLVQGSASLSATPFLWLQGSSTIAALSTINALPDVQQRDTIPAIQGLGRVRVDVYDVDGNKLNFGPIVSGLMFKYGMKLDEIGTFELQLPADEDRIQYIGHRFQLWFYRENEGLCFKGEVKSIETDITNEPSVTIIKGMSIASKLGRLNTGIGRAYQGASLATVGADLLSGTGWATGALDVPATTLLARFDGYSRWAALAKVALQLGIHIREDNLDTAIDMGAFGDTSGLVFRNVAQVSPVLRQNLNLVPVSQVKIVATNIDLWNNVTAVGGGEGVNQLTLKDSTRTTPYPIQVGIGPDGLDYYYIEDAASIAAYGLSETVTITKDAVPLANSLFGFQAASNALYDIAATFLRQHAQPIETYTVSVEGLRHIVGGNQHFKLGQKVRLQYTGAAIDADGSRRTWMSKDTDVWIMAFDRTINSDGSDTWQVTVSTVDILPDTAVDKITNAFTDMRAMQVSLKNYTFQAPYILQRASVQAGAPATLYAKLDANISLLHLAKLSINVRAVRSNVNTVANSGGTVATATNQSATTTTSGGSHSHSFSGSTSAAGGSHTHTVPASAIGSANDPSGPYSVWQNVASNQPSVSATDLQSAGHVHFENGAGNNTGNISANHNHAMPHYHVAGSSVIVTSALHYHTGSGTTSASGGSHSHGVSGGTTAADTGHSHTYSHTHDVTIPAHNHTLAYGIFTGANPTNPFVTITINGVDVTAALGGPFNTVNAEYTLDVTAYLQAGATEQPMRQTNTIAIGASVLCDIEAILRLDLTRSALIPV